MKAEPDELVLFQLYRQEDASGVSGTGTVAFGVKWPAPNERVTLAWVTNYNSVAVYDSLEDVKNIHGHGGKTKLIQMQKIDCGSP